MKLSEYKKTKIYKTARLVAEMREDNGRVLIPDDFVNGVKWVLKYLENERKNERSKHNNK